jgi:hypothetical protein
MIHRARSREEFAERISLIGFACGDCHACDWRRIERGNQPAMSDPYREQPLPDVLEQQRESVPSTESDLELVEELPMDANEADAIDQHRTVPVYDEDDGAAQL